MTTHPSFKHRGVSLLFALLSLAALSLATVALVRSVDTSSVVMGNLGFKQDATAAADRATKKAITDRLNNALPGSLNISANGYYATAYENLDVTGQQSTGVRKLIDWDGNGCQYAPGTAEADCTVLPAAELTINENKVRYVIFRLCDAVGDPNATTTSCARPLVSSSSQASKRGKLDYSDYERFTNVSGVYYRIVVRVIGPRNTTSFVETIVHI
ncbi:pilus assembly protein PilX [Aquabacterium sp.]|uniref:pilus assembly protein PilX n=1 Tax=Aquabacterium sp. TaxID=1872578 RepID=UPI002487FB62|nr:pilus assembly protein PilX [Aquabacterium sp.]MDI1259492.1 pilus assembly protein PilX [Aquabacterium sp.]